MIQSRCVAMLIAAALAVTGQTVPKRILYITHSAGFRHDSIGPSVEAMRDIARRTGTLEVTATEDLSAITAENLRQYDALFFFTSGELPISSSQKQALLDFVRGGKGFGGAHSATDTLYSWPEYGDLIGGYFDGHPWVHEARIDVEDPTHPAAAGVGNSWSILEEFYQFREFSRERVRVLMTLDVRSVDLNAEGVNRTDGDFALAWVRPYGNGRVFYTALGHFDETWRDGRFQKMLEGALLWLTGQVEAESAPRTSRPDVTSVQSGDAQAAPGAVVTIRGEGLTSGGSTEFTNLPLPVRLAGTSVLLAGTPIPLLSVSPRTVVAHLPYDLASEAELRAISGAIQSSQPVVLRVERSAPVIVAAVHAGEVVTIFATGLGPVDTPISAGSAAPLDRLVRTLSEPAVTIGGSAARVFFSGLAPGLVGLYQVNVEANTPGQVVLEIEGRRSAPFSF